MNPEERILEMERQLGAAREELASVRLTLQTTRQTLDRTEQERNRAAEEFNKLRRRIFNIQREYTAPDYMSFTLDLNTYWRLGDEKQREEDLAYMIGDAIHSVLRKKSGAEFALAYIQSLFRKSPIENPKS